MRSRGVGREELRPLFARYGRHLAPEAQSGARVVTGLRHEHEPDAVRLVLLFAPERQHEPEVGTRAVSLTERLHRCRRTTRHTEGYGCGVMPQLDHHGAAHALCTMPGDGVPHLVRHDGGKFRIGLGELEDALVDEDLATGQAEGVGHILADEMELPPEITTMRGTGYAPADGLDTLRLLRAGYHGLLRKYLLRFLLAQPHLLLWRDHDELATPGVWCLGARRHEQYSRQKQQGRAQQTAMRAV